MTKQMIPGTIVEVDGRLFEIIKVDCYKDGRWIRNPGKWETFWVQYRGLVYMLSGTMKKAVVHRIAGYCGEPPFCTGSVTINQLAL